MATAKKAYSIRLDEDVIELIKSKAQEFEITASDYIKGCVELASGYGREVLTRQLEYRSRLISELRRVQQQCNVIEEQILSHDDVSDQLNAILKEVSSATKAAMKSKGSTVDSSKYWEPIPKDPFPIEEKAAK